VIKRHRTPVAKRAPVAPELGVEERRRRTLDHERRSQTTSEERARSVDRLGAHEIQIDELDPSAMFDRILPPARAHSPTVDGTLYLELAARTGAPFASLDRELNEAPRQVGVGPVGDSL